MNFWPNRPRNETGDLRTRHIRATLWVFGTGLLHISLVFLATKFCLNESRLCTTKYLNFSVLLYTCLTTAYLILYPVYVMVAIRPQRLLKSVWEGYRRHLFSCRTWLFSVPVLLFIPIVKSVYSSFKIHIPKFIFFKYDQLFYEMDRFLFWGTDPWVVLHGILGEPHLTIAIDFLYHRIWFALLFTVVVWHALGRHSLYLRVRFFVSYIILWALLGNLGATLLSSAGPCFFDKLPGMANNPYDGLLFYLHSLEPPLSALTIQEFLWTSHDQGVFGYGSGISAMPSMHVATTVLFALSAHAINRWIGFVFSFYAGIVLIGSIFLAWHYAIDGFVSIIATWLIWRLVGWLLLKDRLLCMPSKEAHPSR